jgi:mitochondrial inner membrane protease subunit 1
MEPTIRGKGDVVLVSKMFNARSLRRGDVTVCISPEDPNKFICKRIIGLEGDWIHTDSFLPNSTIVPVGHVWVEGDNRWVSLDSKRFGPVPMGLIQGVVICKVC